MLIEVISNPGIRAEKREIVLETELIVRKSS